MKRQVMVAMVAALVAAGGWAADPETRPAPNQAPADAFMGEYVGTFTPAGGRGVKAEAKVVPGKAGAYKVLLLAELPGEGEKKPTPVRIELWGKAKGGRLPFAGKVGRAHWAGVIADGKLTAEGKGEGGGKFDLAFTVRKSPTEGLKPTEGAVVLLPIAAGPPPLDAWRNRKWQALPGGVVEVRGGSNTTVRGFGDMKLHLEFMIPYEPGRRGQGRGNSGVYIQCRYEVQILDSFADRPRINGCASLYRLAAPKVNASLPPLRWQTYDITFRQPLADKQGKLLKTGKITVLHNGIKVLDDVQFKTPTGSARGTGLADRAPLKLQDHGHPVRFRNIWLVELEERQVGPEPGRNAAAPSVTTSSAFASRSRGGASLRR